MHQRVAAIVITLLFSVLGTAAQAANKGAEMPPAAVEIAPVKIESWQPTIMATGTLAANQGVMLRAETAGRVTGIYFRSGDLVKAGAPLLQINPAVLTADYAAANAKAKLARENYTRTIALYKKHVFAKADLDNAYANYTEAQAAAAQAHALLAQTLICAPFSGRLGLRQVNLGDYVTSGQAIASLSATDPLRVDFSMPENYLNQVAVGQTVLISSRSYTTQNFRGKVYALDAMIDPNTRTLGVRAVLPNKNNQLTPGAYVDVQLLASTPQKIIFVPQTALSYEGNTIYLYKVVQGKAVKTLVTTGNRKGDDIAITQGLRAGDKVITAGQMKVGDGQPVTAGS